MSHQHPLNKFVAKIPEGEKFTTVTATSPGAMQAQRWPDNSVVVTFQSTNQQPPPMVAVNCGIPGTPTPRKSNVPPPSPSTGDFSSSPCYSSVSTPGSPEVAPCQGTLTPPTTPRQRYYVTRSSSDSKTNN